MLGIAPGIQNLGYCVLSFSDELTELPTVKLTELLKGVWMRDAKLPSELQKKMRAHVLTLDVVLERFPPVVLAVGPPALPKESALQIEAARFALKLIVAELARQGFPIRYMEWRTKDDLAQALGADKWATVLDGRLKNPNHPLQPPFAKRLKKPALQLAAATALAGGSVLMKEKSRVTSAG